MARTARPRKKPNRKEIKDVEEVKEVEDEEELKGLVALKNEKLDVGRRPRTKAAATMAMVSMALKGMSVAAACEKAIMPTVVGNRRSTQRTVSAP